ncbi:hypothetical protein AURDEDRAFT_122404 [Auricularia subglabra TFB-10046 SS5]|nr:hypothetical protein AURDEDRAFT_122404 [Auricularia subglabra TFB-10046 SS5]
MSARFAYALDVLSASASWRTELAAGLSPSDRAALTALLDSLSGDAGREFVCLRPDVAQACIFLADCVTNIGEATQRGDVAQPFAALVAAGRDFLAAQAAAPDGSAGTIGDGSRSERDDSEDDTVCEGRSETDDDTKALRLAVNDFLALEQRLAEESEAIVDAMRAEFLDLIEGFLRHHQAAGEDAAEAGS